MKSNTYKFQLSRKARIFAVYIGKPTKDEALSDVMMRFGDKYKIKYLGEVE